MQISRHWRLNPQRYRLQGVRYENGEVSLQARPAPLNAHEQSEQRPVELKHEKVAMKVAS